MIWTPIKCFLLVPTEKCKRYLRRYSSGSNNCTRQMSYHDAMIWFETIKEIDGGDRWVKVGASETPPHWDPRWPQLCECGYRFSDGDRWDVFEDHVYKRTDTGEEMTLRDAPDGAMWDATWFHSSPGWCGEDGKALVCRVPVNHDWMIDGPASNCTRKNEPHKCWVRHGEPPNLTVDKKGNTCSAGAGSIQTKEWHGFLRGGYLVT